MSVARSTMGRNQSSETVLSTIGKTQTSKKAFLFWRMARTRTPLPFETKNGIILTLKSSNYLLSAYVGLEHRGMQTIRAVLDTGAGPNLVRSNMPSLGWRHAFDTQSFFPSLVTQIDGL